MNLLLIGALAGMARWASVDTIREPQDRRLASALAGATTAIFSLASAKNINWGFQPSFFVGLVLPMAAFLVLRPALAIGREFGTVYTPWFWRWIMVLIGHVPERMFVRTKL